MDCAHVPRVQVRLVLCHIALAVDDAHLAIRPNDPVLHVVALAAGECFRHRSHDAWPVFGMNELLIARNGYRAFVRRQAENAVALLRPVDEPGADVTFPVADTGHTPGRLRLALAFSQVGGPLRY